MSEVVPFLIFIAISIGFTTLGIYGLRRPKELARFFRAFGGSIFGEKFANQVYTPANLLWATVPFVLIGPAFAVFGVIGLIRALSS